VGKVYLIGTGPGDPELMTLKAVRRLQEADVVLIDALVDRAVLRHARANARVIDVGKRGGCRSTPQRFIERLMVRHARQGRIVARLKGGDPYVFGRGGEEARALIAAQVPVEVVSGVSAGFAAPAAAGIPVTLRGIASGVAFVTGHSAGGVEPDCAALVRAGMTLVMFMAIARMAQIAKSLLDGGTPVNTPVAVIERATWSTQRVVRGTLAQLSTLARDISGPATLVVGAVAAYELATVDTISQALGERDSREAA